MLELLGGENRNCQYSFYLRIAHSFLHCDKNITSCGSSIYHIQILHHTMLVAGMFQNALEILEYSVRDVILTL
jgi:hypothetical protein